MASMNRAFCLRFTDDRKRVCQRRRERYRLNTMMQQGKPYGLGRCCYDRRTGLILVPDNLTGQQYVNEILRPVVVPMARRIGQNFTFQDDNAIPQSSCCS